MSSLTERLSGLVFSSTELKAITGWDDRLVEDYLSIVDSLRQLAGGSASESDLEAHVNDLTIHFTEASIDHLAILNIGVYDHDDIDNHIDDLTIHFTEASIDHENIQNIGVYSHDDIDNHIDDVTGNPHQVNLQQAYDEGQSIATGSGPVEIDNTGESDAGLRVVPNSTFPTTGLTGGELHVDTDGTIYTYDDTRSKWQSVAENMFLFADNGGTDSEYLRMGFANSTSIGYVMPYDGTIRAIEAISQAGNPNKGFEVEINGSVEISFNLSGNAFEDLNEDTDFDAGDVIQVFCVAAGGGTNTPMVQLHTKWRK